MKSCFRLLILQMGLFLGVASLPGCHSHRSSQELLERELRWQENEIFNLCDSLEEFKQRLDACRRENEALKRQLDGGSTDTRTPLPSRGNQNTAPQIHAPAIIELPPHSISPPSVPLISPPGQLPESGNPPTGELILPRPTSTSTGTMGEAPRFETAPLYPASEGGTPAREVNTRTNDETSSTGDATSKEVDRITLNKLLTGGHNADSHGGDDGVMVHLEPRNQRGELVETPGEVSIVVLDPTLQGNEARVARWDFTVDETAVRYQKAGLTPGYHFEPRWPNRPPANRTLDLHVRFTTLEGRRLEASKRIDIEAVVTEEREGGDPSSAANGQWNRSTSTARVPSKNEELAPRWPTESMPIQPTQPTAPPSVESIARPPVEPTPVKPPAGKPGWSPYR